MKNPVLNAIGSAFGLPCWQVRWDCQVGLDMQLGQPSLSIRAPRHVESTSARVRAQFARREVFLRGTHWLVLYPGTWRLRLADGLDVRDTASTRRLDMACARLRGEKLRGIRIEPANGTSTFFFDLGAVLIARWPNGVRAEDDSELWSLHVPRARFLSMYGNGTYRFGSTRWGKVPPVLLAPRDARDPIVIGRARTLKVPSRHV